VLSLLAGGRAAEDEAPLPLPTPLKDACRGTQLAPKSPERKLSLSGNDRVANAISAGSCGGVDRASSVKLKGLSSARSTSSGIS